MEDKPNVIRPSTTKRVNREEVSMEEHVHSIQELRA